MVARLRGAKWRLNDAASEGIAFRALADVAAWLGYSGHEWYNAACKSDPEEVERRLREYK